MLFREAHIQDIEQIMDVRLAVNENKLVDPKSVNPNDCIEYLTLRGKGWVCEVQNRIIGFSIVDLKENNVWALFVLPKYEEKGVGSKLHNLMLNWYFNETKQTLTLSTDSKTRAEKFYLHNKWKPLEILQNGELKFEMTYLNWKKLLSEL